MASTATLTHPLGAAAPGWVPPDFNLESRRRPNKHSPSTPQLSFTIAFPPDEELGRTYRTLSQTTTSFFEAAGDEDKEGGDRERGSPFSGEVEQDEDALLELFLADGGAGGAAEEETVSREDSEQADEVTGSEWSVGNRSPPRPQPRVDWTEVLDHCVTNAEGRVDLECVFSLFPSPNCASHLADLLSASTCSGRDISEVPSSIAELSMLVSFNVRGQASGRPFARTQTVPANGVASSPPSRKFTRTASGPFSPTSAPSTRCSVPVHLILSNNNLVAGSISNALWTLSNCASLSLRRNNLEHLPEGVGRLSNLTELNVAGNQLLFLPAEVLQLHNLGRLGLYPNNFLPPPVVQPDASSADSPSPPSPRSRRLLSALTTHFTIPSLRETCIRRLLSPISPLSPAPATDLYDRETLKSYLSSALLEPFLSTVYPATSSHPLSTSQSFTRARHASSSSAHLPPSTQPFDPLSSVCCSLAHDGEERVFFEPAVELFEWVSERQLQPGADKPKSEVRNVPVRWRGCSASCLDWLEEEVEEEESDE